MQWTFYGSIMLNRLISYNLAPGTATRVFLMIGMAFIGFGLLVLFVPEILVAIISGILILIGSAFLALAWMSRQTVNGFKTWHDEF